MICYMFQDQEIKFDDMTRIFPSSQPILKEKIYFFIGINNLPICFCLKVIFLYLVNVTNHKYVLQVIRPTYQISNTTNDLHVYA